jgi:protein-disulfide isomerase
MKLLLTLALAAAAAATPVKHAKKPAAAKDAQPAAAAQQGPGLAGVFYDDAYVLGSPKAKVVLTEYASPVCPHCARFDADVWPKIKARYVDTGLVRYEFREMLTDPTELAAAALIVARCTGKAHYFSVIEGFFRAQPDMYAQKPGSEPVNVLTRLAHENGVEHDRFEACLNDKTAVDKLNARIDHAVNGDKIAGTPTVLINGVKADPGVGEWTADRIDAALAPYLKTGTKGR